jgi:thymidylate synthase (FAD)
VSAWLKDMGADEFEAEYSNGDHDGISDPAFVVALAAKQCYMAFQPSLNPNLTKVRKDMVEYLENILKQAHGSVMEHAVYTYGINGCSRVFTGEINRHRAGVAISERSMRYIRYQNIEFWMPLCFRDDGEIGTLQQREASRTVLTTAFEMQEAMMHQFEIIWQDQLMGGNFHTKKVLTSAFRRGIGMGIATGGVWSFNLRAMRHILALRTSAGAEEEIVHGCMKIGRDIIEDCPELFADFQEKNGSLVPTYWKV